VYCLASDQRVNNDRPVLFFGKGCKLAVSGSIKNILEVPNDSLNDKYLGLPSDVGRSALAIDKLARTSKEVGAKVKAKEVGAKVKARPASGEFPARCCGNLEESPQSISKMRFPLQTT
jgi:hypothetical protein